MILTFSNFTRYFPVCAALIGLGLLASPAAKAEEARSAHAAGDAAGTSAHEAGAGTGTIMGVWATDHFGSMVDIQPCSDDANKACGRIIWIWHALDDDGNPRTDKENPDKAKRSRPLLGVELLKDFEEVKPGVWKHGGVYNPDDGRTYGGSIKVIDANSIEMEGCALGIFCKSQIWNRPQMVCSAATEALNSSLSGGE